MATSSPEVVATHPRGLALVAFMLLAVVAALAYVVSGLFALLVLVLTPEPGAALLVLIMKAILAIGWLAVGWWLLLDFWRGRWRFVAAPVAAWALVYGAFLMLQGSAFLNFGY